MINNKSKGFSIVELMLALVAGLIVIGAITSFTVSVLRSSSENIQATRLVQGLRTGMSLVQREIRRAGFDQNAIETVGSGTTSTTFNTFTLAKVDTGLTGQNFDCVILTYDRNGNTTIDTGERKGFRRVVVSGVGILQANLSTAAPACNNDAGWENITEPSAVNVSRFVLADNIALQAVPGVTGAEVCVRDVDITLTGTLVSDATVTRSMQSRIRVRADVIDTGTTTDCNPY